MFHALLSDHSELALNCTLLSHFLLLYSHTLCLAPSFYCTFMWGFYCYELCGFWFYECHQQQKLSFLLKPISYCFNKSIMFCGASLPPFPNIMLLSKVSYTFTPLGVLLSYYFYGHLFACSLGIWFLWSCYVIFLLIIWKTKTFKPIYVDMMHFWHHGAAPLLSCALPQGLWLFI